MRKLLIKSTFISHIFLGLFVSKAPLFAAEVGPVGVITIDFQTRDKNDLWIARMFQEGVKSYVSGFSNILIQDPSENFVKCDNQDCIFKDLAEQKVDYFWTGKYSDGSVDYEIVDVPTRATVRSGSLKIGGWHDESIQVQALKAVKPIVRAGGLIDMRLEQQQNIQRLEISGGLDQYVAAGIWSNIAWLLALLGGCAWAYVLLKISQFCAGSLFGIHRINHSSLFIYLRAWLEVLAGKVLISALVFAPPLIGLYVFLVPRFVTAQFYVIALSPLVAFALLGIIFVGHWYMTKRLDRLYLKIAREPIWHDRIDHYLQNYLKRLGLELPDGLLEKVRFYVAPIEGEIIYGGFGLGIRVVIPSSIVEMAMGSVARFDLHRPDGPIGMDNTERTPASEWEVRSQLWAKDLRGELPLRKSEDAFDGLKNELLKQSAEHEIPPSPESAPPFAIQAGVWGFILPHKKSETVGLISDDSQDLEIVEELMNEHHIHFYKPKVEEEFDDSDPDQKDFFFGVLLQLLGYAHRRETVVTTLSLYAQRWYRWIPRIGRKPFEYLADQYERNYSRFPAFIADAYVALNHGGPHLVQYFYYLSTRKGSQMTSRGERRLLSQRANEIIKWVSESKPTEADLHRNAATLRNRLFWVASFFQYQINPRQYLKRWPWKRIVTAIAFSVLLGIQIYASIDFHPTYIERLAGMNKALDDYNIEQDEIAHPEKKVAREKKEAKEREKAEAEAREKARNKKIESTKAATPPKQDEKTKAKPAAKAVEKAKTKSVDKNKKKEKPKKQERKNGKR